MVLPALLVFAPVLLAIHRGRAHGLYLDMVAGALYAWHHKINPAVVRRYRRLIKNPTIRERLVDQEAAGNRQFIDALIYRGWRVELSANGSNNTYA